MNKAKKAKILFLDRDGIINVDHGYVFKTSDFEFVEGFPDILHYLTNLGYVPAVVTNQSGVARGYFTEQDVYNFHSHINEKLKEEIATEIEYFQVCPHHVSGSVAPYNCECQCRKPKTGLIDQFQSVFDHDIDFEKSIMIGDKESDVELGKAKGMKSFQLDHGKYKISERADHVIKNLSEIKSIISS